MHSHTDTQIHTLTTLTYAYGKAKISAKDTTYIYKCRHMTCSFCRRSVKMMKLTWKRFSST